MDCCFEVSHPWVNDQYFGQSIGDFVVEIFEVSNPATPKLLSRTFLQKEKHYLKRIRLAISGGMYQWSIRRAEFFKSGRDYEVLICFNSVKTDEKDRICYPESIKTLIGEFVTPIIATGFIIFEKYYLR